MSLSKAKPISNYVLIKLEKNDKIMLDNGVVVFLPSENQQQNPEEHRPLRGEVVLLPEKLNFTIKDHSGLKWDCEMELEVGDKVIVRRPALSMALSKEAGSYFVEEGEIYYYLKYDEIIVGINSDNEIKVLNGYVIVEPLKMEYETSLIVPDMSKRDSQMYGIVRYIGKPNKAYLPRKNAKLQDDTPTDDIVWVRKEDGEVKVDLVELQVGDKIQFKPTTATPIEQDLHRTLAGRDTKLYRMQRFNIIARI